jgi:hypothetical protein
MDDEILCDKIVNIIKRSIPKNIKTTDYLMGKLGLSRESVYRRIRKEIPFSIVELVKLSLDLGFSIDEIVESNKSTHLVFDSKLTAPTKNPNPYISLFQGYDNYLNILVNAEKSETSLALNEFPPLFTIFNENLFKFNYYKDIVTRTPKNDIGSFLDMKIPRELRSLLEKISVKLLGIKNVTIICSPNIYHSIIKNIQYLYQRKQLTSDELLLLKEEVLNWINFGEMVTESGFFGKDTKVDIYLSTFLINSDVLFMQYGEESETHIWIYDNDPLMIKNKEICSTQIEWFQALKNRSSLISQSNEILRENFFDMQRDYTGKCLTEDNISMYI